MRDQWAELKLLVGTAVRTDPKRCVGALLEPLGALAVPLYGLLLGVLANAILTGTTDLLLLGAAGLLGVIVVQYVANWVGTSMRARLAEEVGFRFDHEITTLTSRLPTVDHLERPEYADTVELLRQGQGLLGQSVTYIATTASAVVSALGTVAVLVWLDPVVLLLILFALPAFGTVSMQRRWESAAESASAEPARLARHLRTLSTRPDAGLELRAYGLEHEILDRAQVAWTRSRRSVQQAFFKSSLLAAGRAALFAVGFTLVVGYVLWRATTGHASPGDVVTAVVVCQQVQRQVIGPTYSIAGLGRVLRNAGRVRWLRSYAQAELADRPAGAPSPDRLAAGITLDHVWFRYPGADGWALRDVCTTLPAGSAVAVLGENGAGKSTLVKLMGGLHEPTRGRILVDGVDLRELDLDRWRERLSATFQDYTRPELTARRAIGLGDLANVDDAAATGQAADRAGAQGIVTRLQHGMDQQLGSTWPDGTDLSGGEWQRLALARGLMRTAPLVLFLDEPTASLDAAAEHNLFERYIGQAREMAAAAGTVTVLVTHRFSTVYGADTICVLDRGRLAEVGTHHDLVSRDGGLYRELYEIQANAYG